MSCSGFREAKPLSEAASSSALSSELISATRFCVDSRRVVGSFFNAASLTPPVGSALPCELLRGANAGGGGTGAGKLGVVDSVIGACVAGLWHYRRRGGLLRTGSIPLKNLGYGYRQPQNWGSNQAVPTSTNWYNPPAAGTFARLFGSECKPRPQTLPVRPNRRWSEFLPLAAVEMPNPIMREVSTYRTLLLAACGDSTYFPTS